MQGGLKRNCAACKGDGCVFCAYSGDDMSTVEAIKAIGFIPGLLMGFPAKEEEQCAG